jgi:tetratricopeptide (TPR) repeat protein
MNSNHLEAYYFKRFEFKYNLNQNNEAIDCFNRVIELDSKYLDAYKNKGIVLYHINKYGKSLECFNKAFQLDSNNLDANKYKKLILEKMKIFYL